MSVELRHRAEPYHFKFDCVLPDTTTQEEVFERKQQHAQATDCLSTLMSRAPQIVTSNHRGRAADPPHEGAAVLGQPFLS